MSTEINSTDELVEAPVPSVAESIAATISEEDPPGRVPRRRAAMDIAEEEEPIVVRGKRAIEAERSDVKIKKKKKKKFSEVEITKPELVASAGLNDMERSDVKKKKKKFPEVEFMKPEIAASAGPEHAAPEEKRKRSSSKEQNGTKLTVYSMQHGPLQRGVGNAEFKKDCEAAKFLYFDPEATPESRAAVVESILHRYEFCSLNEERARAKIVKTVSEKRGFYDKLTTDEDRIKYADLKHYKFNVSHREPRNLPVGDGVKHRTRPRRTVPKDSARPAPKRVSVESEYLHEYTTSGAYIEELAFHHCHQKDVGDEDLGRLEPLPPPPSEIPCPPPHDTISWNFDPETRVYLVDFSSVRVIPKEQKWFLGSLMERDDITVICEGLYEKEIDVKQFLYKLGCSFGNTPYGKFRQFTRRSSEETGLPRYEEKDGYISMEVKPKFLNYVARNVYGGTNFDSCTFALDTPIEATAATVSDAAITTDGEAEGATDTSDPDAFTSDQSIYMTDVEMINRFPRFDREYKKKFKMPEILPGGEWCLMSHLPEFTLPFMGPNLYISPGGGFTQMHQDGHGTVDSGHSCLSGYNEVVMLRRLPECHKRNACQLIPSETTDRTVQKQRASNVLFRLPHDDGRKDKLLWPKNSTIESWSKMGYCPSVFMLKPGQHLLINKGRLHAFRKMTFDDLSDDDCHAKLRFAQKEELKSQNIHRPPLCISVAFDWSFSGITAEGINRELSATIESASACREFSTCKSLAIPETAILKIAETLPHLVNPDLSPRSVFPESEEICVPSFLDIVRGIFPALQYITERDQDEMKQKRAPKTDLPDTHPYTSRSTVDPFGNDYFCKICSHELANTYFHCNGCEEILSKDFNICIRCYNEESYRSNIEMSSSKAHVMASHFHHLGRPSDQCNHPSKKCWECDFCGKCSFNACVCHKSFQKRFRFYSAEQLQAMFEFCVNVLNGNYIKFHRETLHRLRGEVLVPRQLKEIGVDGTATGDVRDAVVGEEKVILKSPSGVELCREEKGSAQVVKGAFLSAKQERNDNSECLCQCIPPDSQNGNVEPSTIAETADDEKSIVDDDVVEISPSKKLRTDNLEISYGAIIEDAYEIKASSNQKGILGSRRKRLPRTDSLGYRDDKCSSQIVENESEASSDVEEMKGFAAV